ncbi:MAG: hypothetical protein AAFP98_05915 [Pseudomonadota bacterium]
MIFPGLVVASLSAGPSQAATFLGEFWDVSSANFSINQALNAIDGVAPTATFTSQAIDYPNGATNRQSSSLSLASFLGTDAASIVGDGTRAVTTSVFRFTGYVDLLPGQQSFALGSDDGFRLTLDNTVVAQQNRPRGFRFTNLAADAGDGRVPFELIFYENFGRTGLEFFIDNSIIVPASIPVPATAGLGLMGVATLAGLGMRRRGSDKPLAPTG